MTYSELAKELSADGYKHEPDAAEIKFLSTGFPPLDYAISGRYKDGGLPQARMVEMGGPSSSGKTAIATYVMAEAQRRGGFAIFNDHEQSFDDRLAVRLGLSLEFPQWIYREPDTYEQSVDQTFDIVEKIRANKKVPKDAPIVAVFDSLASMIPQSQWDKGDTKNYKMNDKLALASCTSQTMKLIAKKAKKLNILFLFLNQIRMKPGVMYGDPTTMPGGNAPEFYSSVRIKLGKKMIKDENKQVIGQEVGAECIKNKVSRPFQRANWKFIFDDDGTGYFDVIASFVDHLVDIGKIKESGSRVEWNGKKIYRKELVKVLKSAPEDAMEIMMALAEQHRKEMEDGSKSD